MHILTTEQPPTKQNKNVELRNQKWSYNKIQQYSFNSKEDKKKGQKKDWIYRK